MAEYVPKEICSECEGTGLQLPLCDSPCQACDGNGLVPKAQSKPKKPPALSSTDEDQLVAALCDIEDLNDWEMEFAESLFDRLASGDTLTEKQKAKALEIVRRCEN